MLVLEIELEMKKYTRIFKLDLYHYKYTYTQHQLIELNI